MSSVPPLAQQWTFRLPGERNVSVRRPVIADATVYVAFGYDRKGFFGSTLFAFDVATGAQRWSYRIDHVGNEPVVADGVVYWSSFEGAVHALDRDGRLIWKGPGADSSLGIPVAGDGNGLFVSEIAGGARYTWCLDGTTGATRWRFGHGGHAYQLFHSADRVYHTSVAPTAMDDATRCTLYCLSAPDGRVVWSVAGSEYLFNPIVLDGRVHVCSHRKLYVHAVDDGRRLGEATIGSERATMTLAPCSSRDRLVVWENNTGREGEAVSAWTIVPVKRWFGGERLDATRLWRIDEPSGLCDPPIARSEDQMAYLTRDGVVQVVSSATGERMWSLKLKSDRGTTGGLAFSDGLLVATHGREVFLFSRGS